MQAKADRLRCGVNMLWLAFAVSLAGCASTDGEGSSEAETRLTAQQEEAEQAARQARQRAEEAERARAEAEAAREEAEAERQRLEAERGRLQQAKYENVDEQGRTEEPLQKDLLAELEARKDELVEQARALTRQAQQAREQQ